MATDTFQEAVMVMYVFAAATGNICHDGHKKVIPLYRHSTLNCHLSCSHWGWLPYPCMSPLSCYPEEKLSLCPGSCSIFGNHKSLLSLGSKGTPGPIGCHHNFLWPELSNPKLSHHTVIRMM